MAKAGRASNGSGTIREKRNNCFELRWTVDGKQKSKSFKTFTEADKARRQITAAVDNGTYVEPQKMKLSEWLDIWSTTYCHHIKRSTLIQYKSYIRNHINPAIGNIRLDRLQPHHVQDMVNNLGRTPKKINESDTNVASVPASNEASKSKQEKPLTYKTRKNIHGALSAALAKAVDLKYMRDNPATGCTIPKDDSVESIKVINPFTTEELTAFLNAAEESIYRDIYHLSLDTGMRLSECIGLRWSRIDMKRSRITVDCQLHMLREKGDSRYLVKTKNSKVRTFKVSKQVIDLLNDIKLKQFSNTLKAGSAWNNDLDLVFTDVIGQPLIHSSIEHDFKRIVRKIGCPDHRFHDLRHTFATLSLQHGANQKTLSEVLGHFSVAFTLDVYGHVSEEMADDFAAIQEQIISFR